VSIVVLYFTCFLAEGGAALFAELTNHSASYPLGIRIRCRTLPTLTPYASHTHHTDPTPLPPQARNPAGGQFAAVSEAWGTEGAKLTAREQFPGNDRWVQVHRCQTLTSALGDAASGYCPRNRSSVFDVEVAVPGVGSSGWLLERAQAEQWQVRKSVWGKGGGGLISDWRGESQRNTLK
jgi:hypothetical protein